DEIEQQLKEKEFSECGAQEALKLGWTPAIGKKESPFIHVCDKFWMLRLTKQERILPSSVLNEEIALKCEEIEETQQRKVSRKEKSEIKEIVTQALLPLAFKKTTHIYGYICPSEGYLVVDSASAKQTDEFTSFLRNTIGSLPVRIPAVNCSPASTMTAWLTEDEDLPANFELNAESELISLGEDKASVKYKGLELDKDQIDHNKALGFQVKKQALVWDDKIAFILNDDLTLKRMKFLDVIQDKMDNTNAETKEEKFDASFSIMTMELDQLITEILNAFGGEDIESIAA
ncbi:hypothetical protein A3715_31485, partial [Oleiphilus sp. HI0009]